MRTIKFRIKTDHGWKILDLTNSSGIARELLELMAKDDSVFVFGCELQQFAGLHDRNGKEIYEGDILKFLDYSSVVEWNVNGHWAYRRIEDKALFGEDYWKSEVIGNIHENPELLDGRGEA